MALFLGSLTRVSAQCLVGLAAGTAKTTGQTVSSTWRYATDDAAATVEAAGYFNGARDQLRAGDVILASMAMGGTPVTKQYICTASPATGNVTIALQVTTAG